MQGLELVHVRRLTRPADTKAFLLVRLGNLFPLALNWLSGDVGRVGKEGFYSTVVYVPCGSGPMRKAVLVSHLLD